MWIISNFVLLWESYRKLIGIKQSPFGVRVGSISFPITSNQNCFPFLLPDSKSTSHPSCKSSLMRCKLCFVSFFSDFLCVRFCVKDFKSQSPLDSSAIKADKSDSNHWINSFWDALTPCTSLLSFAFVILLWG